MLLLITLPMMFSCGSDDVETLLTEEEARIAVDEAYNEMISILPGNWEPSDIMVGRNEWKPTSPSWLTPSYVFNSDGTYTLSYDDTYKKGTYRLVKNYNARSKYSCMLFIVFDEKKPKVKIWLEDGYLRIYHELSDEDYIPRYDYHSGSDELVRYKKVNAGGE